MKDKSLFSQVILLAIVIVLCILTTVLLALLAGSVQATIFDFRNLNFGNMLPVLLIGGFLSIVVIGITILFISRNAFLKVNDYLKSNKEDNRRKEK